jgi:rubrerythrin
MDFYGFGKTPILKESKKMNIGMEDTTEIKSTGSIGVHEVFQIAMQVERNGAEFYRRAAKLYDNLLVSDVLNRLSKWEHENLGATRRMYARFVRHSRKHGIYRHGKLETPEGVLMAGLAGFGIHPDPADELSGHESCIQVLNFAVQKERDAVVFYTGLKGFMDDPNEHENIDEVINEEIRHITYLEQAIQQLLDTKKATGFEDTSREKCLKCDRFACTRNANDLP